MTSSSSSSTPPTDDEAFRMAVVCRANQDVDGSGFRETTSYLHVAPLDDLSWQKPGVRVAVKVITGCEAAFRIAIARLKSRSWTAGPTTEKDGYVFFDMVAGLKDPEEFRRLLVFRAWKMIEKAGVADSLEYLDVKAPADCTPENARVLVEYGARNQGQIEVSSQAMTKVIVAGWKVGESRTENHTDGMGHFTLALEPPADLVRLLSQPYDVAGETFRQLLADEVMGALDEVGAGWSSYGLGPSGATLQNPTVVLSLLAPDEAHRAKAREVLVKLAPKGWRIKDSDEPATADGWINFDVTASAEIAGRILSAVDQELAEVER